MNEISLSEIQAVEKRREAERDRIMDIPLRPDCKLSVAIDEFIKQKKVSDRKRYGKSLFDGLNDLGTLINGKLR